MGETCALRRWSPKLESKSFAGTVKESVVLEMLAV